MSYFNTTSERGAKLKVFDNKSEAQEANVIKIFKTKRGDNLTASEVLRLYPEKGILITSIRRAISNLKNWNFLEKTAVKRDGIYGRPECAYRIYTGQQTLF
jgi:hypothetical protein